MKIIRKHQGKIIAEMRLEKLRTGPIEIAYVEVAPGFRGKGIASQMLKRAKAYADRRGSCLAAFLDPDGSGLSTAQMKSWLSRHGFKSDWIVLCWGASMKRGMIYSPIT